MDLPCAGVRCDNRGMVWAEFEEKELEGPLNAQLSMGGPLWSPGQVLEQIVGFDIAIMVDDISFWARLASGHRRPGCRSSRLGVRTFFRAGTRRGRPLATRSR